MNQAAALMSGYDDVSPLVVADHSGRHGRCGWLGRQPRLLLFSRSVLQFRSDGVHQAMTDAGVERVVDLADAGRASDVDFG